MLKLSKYIIFLFVSMTLVTISFAQENITASDLLVKLAFPQSPLYEVELYEALRDNEAKINIHTFTTVYRFSKSKEIGSLIVKWQDLEKTDDERKEISQILAKELRDAFDFETLSIVEEREKSINLIRYVNTRDVSKHQMKSYIEFLKLAEEIQNYKNISKDQNAISNELEEKAVNILCTLSNIYVLATRMDGKRVPLVDVSDLELVLNSLIARSNEKDLTSDKKYLKLSKLVLKNYQIKEEVREVKSTK